MRRELQDPRRVASAVARGRDGVSRIGRVSLARRAACGAGALLFHLTFAQLAVGSPPPSEEVASGTVVPSLSRPPVELRNPAVVAPLETAGSGLAPEALVRVTIDERGRVAEVEVTRLTPSTEHDALFVEAIEETLQRWRYAPRLVDGEPVPAELLWTLQFKARSEDRGRTFESTRAEGDDAESRRAAYMKLASDTRRRLLRGTAEQMMGHFKSTPIQHATPRFVVWTDAEEKTAAAVGNNLESVYGLLAQMFGEHLELQEEPLKMLAFVYSREQSYRQMRSLSEYFEWSSGYYHPLGVLGLHLEVTRPDALLGTLLHEATHAFMDRHIVAPGKQLPRWLGEGFAEYMGNSKVEKKRLVPGKTRKRRAYLAPGGAAIAETAAGLGLVDVKRAMRGGRELSLRQILNAGSDVFYGEKRDLFYPMSWLLVHYLIHGQPGWSEGSFPTFVTYVAEGFAPESSFEMAYGRSAESLEPAFRDYVLRF